MKRLLMGGIVGGIIAFMWGAVSWMALPWHGPALLKFTDEQAVIKVVHENAPVAGTYLLPNPSGGLHQKDYTGPMLFGAVRPVSVSPSDRSYYLRGLGSEMLGALLLTWLLMTLPRMSYWARVRTGIFVALVGAAMSYVPDANWWGFSRSYTTLKVVDAVAAYTFASLAIARIVGDRYD